MDSVLEEVPVGHQACHQALVDGPSRVVGHGKTGVAFQTEGDQMEASEGSLVVGVA